MSPLPPPLHRPPMRPRPTPRPGTATRTSTPSRWAAKVGSRARPKEASSGSDGSGITLKGRISFFSRSNCRDCTAVRSFFREKGLPYVEINVDVFPARERDLIARAGSASVSQVFFNEKLVGGLVALNSLRNSGEFDGRLREMAGRRCPDSAPQVPVYGFDDEEETVVVVEGKGKDRGADAMVGIVRVLRQRLPIQDRLTKMKIVMNCFAGKDLVEAVINHLDCGRRKNLGDSNEH